jgi:hypothetical protein
MRRLVVDRITALETHRPASAGAVPESFKRLVGLVTKTVAARSFFDLGRDDSGEALPVDQAMHMVWAEVPDLWGSPEREVRQVVATMLNVQRLC